MVSSSRADVPAAALMQDSCTWRARSWQCRQTNGCGTPSCPICKQIYTRQAQLALYRERSALCADHMELSLERLGVGLDLTRALVDTGGLDEDIAHQRLALLPEGLTIAELRYGQDGKSMPTRFEYSSGGRPSA